MFNQHAGIFYDGQACGAGFPGGGGVGDTELEPENFCAYGDGGIGYRGNIFGAAENVNDVNSLGDVFEARVAFCAKDFGFVGIHGDDAVAGGLQVGGYFVAWAGRVGGEADYGDGF